MIKIDKIDLKMGDMYFKTVKDLLKFFYAVKNFDEPLLVKCDGVVMHLNVYAIKTLMRENMLFLKCDEGAK